MNYSKQILYSLCLIITISIEINAKTIAFQKQSKPNIVFILADDLGYGDLSCYGQQKFATPHIDLLAKKGMIFTQHYSGCTVCAPSRSALLTGLHTGHTPIRCNVECKPEGQYPLVKSAYTLAEMLKKAGYNTGAFGKWGLGFIGTDGDPNNQGFEVFYGYNCQNLAHNYYPDHLWSNSQRLILEGNLDSKQIQYAPDMIHDQAIQFIQNNHPKKTGKPFFLFYSTPIPHAELAAPEENIKRFRGQFEPEKRYEGATYGTEIFRKGAYGSQLEAHATFVAMVDYLDQKVGDIMQKLQKLGLDENTLIIFSSDNWPNQEGGADPDNFDHKGAIKGQKKRHDHGGKHRDHIAILA